ncbi:MAG: phosphoadenosine phosphosulfate reductase [Deltaproteobacteria bacterium RBG_16_71_12]|nr:MAG: phosphoadenosine phosphosulfate reductase [Deltaproteobacteria bacterium RBG_16_71_12]
MTPPPDLEGKDAEAVLAWVETTFGADAAIAASFGVEDVVLIDLVRRHAPSVKVFTIDTGRLHPETYQVMEAVRARYRITIESWCPDARELEALTTAGGHFSFRASVEARQQCCRVRKVHPLTRALFGRKAWLTGLRREQSGDRGAVRVVDVDQQHGGLLKVNPLAAWTDEQTWAHARAHRLPYNRLHDQGFPSIGCAPCTRAVTPGEPARAGRWWWEQEGHKECGLHR